jgi:signal transduction histidine kinase
MSEILFEIKKLIYLYNLDFFIFMALTAFALSLTKFLCLKKWTLSGKEFLLLAAILGSAFFVGKKISSQTAEYSFQEMQNFIPNLKLLLQIKNHDAINAKTEPQDSSYLELIELEKKILSDNLNINDIYTFTKNDDGHFIFLVDSETDYNRNNSFDGDREQRTPIGEVYDNQNELLSEAWAGRQVFTEQPYEDKWGFWISVFSPLKDSQGNVKSIVGLDFSALNFINMVIMDRFKVYLLFFFSVLIFGVVIFNQKLNLHQRNEIIRTLEDKFKVKKELDQQKMKQIEAAKMATLGQMAAGIAHEINNPLAIISGKSSQLKRHVTGSSFDLKYIIEAVETIDLTTKRVSKIIKGLKSFSRNSENDPFEPTAVKTIVDDTLALCGEKLKNRQIFLEVNLEPNLVVNARPSQISQILLNLINNSFDAIEKTEFSWIKIEGLKIEGKIILSVTDSGFGIEKSIKDSIMNPFFTTKEVGKGTGLGLSISYGLIAEHGGQLKLDEECKNTKFLIILPEFSSDAKKDQYAS